MDILYDGACALCRRSVRWIRRLDWLGRVRTLSLTDEEELRTLFPGLRREDLLEEMHAVTPDGRVRRGFDAFRRLARSLPPLWPLLPLLYLPGVRPLGRAVYRRIARSRTRDGTSCPAHER